jgi:hypothetical protein
MLVFTVLFATLSLSQVLAGQIPVVNGVIGGVPSSTKRGMLDNGGHDASVASPVTPGKLRVVENSGVCGQCSSSCVRTCNPDISMD